MIGAVGLHRTPKKNNTDNVVTARRGQRIRKEKVFEDFVDLSKPRSSAKKSLPRKSRNVEESSEDDIRMGSPNIGSEYDYGHLSPDDIKQEVLSGDEGDWHDALPSTSTARIPNASGEIAIPLSLTRQNDKIVANPMLAQGQVTPPQEPQLRIMMIDGVPTLMVNHSNLNTINNMVTSPSAINAMVTVRSPPQKGDSGSVAAGTSLLKTSTPVSPPVMRTTRRVSQPPAKNF